MKTDPAMDRVGQAIKMLDPRNTQFKTRMYDQMLIKIAERYKVS